MIDPSFEAGAVRFDGAGLVALVAQDRTSGVVLMVGWTNRAALDLTLESGELWFWSRSRQELWHKGATSGNRLLVRSLHLDCDGDTLLALVDPVGPACHTGQRSCFDGAAGALPQALELGWLAQVVAARAASPSATSYTSSLLARGRGRVAQKVGEEATEVVIAALTAPETLAGEAADLLFHLVVLLESTGTPLSAVAAVLAERHAAKTQQPVEVG